MFQLQYDNFSAYQQGGLLLFALLMDTLISRMSRPFVLALPRGSPARSESSLVRMLGSAPTPFALSLSAKDFNEYSHNNQLKHESSVAPQLVNKMNKAVTSITSAPRVGLTELEVVRRNLLLAEVPYQSHNRNTWTAKTTLPFGASILTHGDPTSHCFNCKKIGFFPQISVQPFDTEHIACNRQAFLARRLPFPSARSSGNAHGSESKGWFPPYESDYHTQMLYPRIGPVPVSHHWGYARKRWTPTFTGKTMEKAPPGALHFSTEMARVSDPGPSPASNICERRSASTKRELISMKEQP